MDRRSGAGSQILQALGGDRLRIGRVVEDLNRDIVVVTGPIERAENWPEVGLTESGAAAVRIVGVYVRDVRRIPRDQLRKRSSLR